MKKFNNDFLDFSKVPKPEPDFNNILKVLKREKPNRNTLFEFFLNSRLEEKMCGIDKLPDDPDEALKCRAEAFYRLGYDYFITLPSLFFFERKNNLHGKNSISVNEGSMIKDRETFEKYNWQDPTKYYNGRIERAEKFLHEGMKIIVNGPDGVLENAMNIMGFDNMCYLVADDPDLLEEIFYNIGTRIVDYYKQVIDYDCVGAVISNDDWGFYSQTMLSTEDMRKYVFPWHKKIAKLAHDANKPVILHSCGNLQFVYDDITYDIKFDGKHSYEDKILPVEKAYDMYSDKFAVLGGMDVDFLARATPEEIYERSVRMIEKTGCKGYALGSGNSIPLYVPDENYLAMAAAVLYNR